MVKTMNFFVLQHLSCYRKYRHKKYMSATGYLVIWCLHLSLVTGRTLVVYRYVVGVGVIVSVGDTWDTAELLAVFLGEFTTETFCRCGKHGVVMVIPFAEVVYTLTHIIDDFQSQFLTLLTLSMVLACQGYKTFCQSDEADAERALVDDTLNGVVGLQFVGTDPQTLHQQWELFGEGCLLELETVIELACSDIEHSVKFLEELVDALLLVLDFHAFDSQSHNVDGRE